MRSLASLCTCVCTSMTLACGSDFATDVGELLPALQPKPSCFTPEPPLPAGEQTLPQLLAARRAMVDFRLSFALQEAQLLTQPLRDDPELEEWSVSPADGVLLEGAVITRGEGWAVVKAVAYAEPHRTMDATIDLLGERAVFDLGSAELEVAPKFVRLDDMYWGCESRQGVSFRVGPGRVGDEVRERVASCWTAGDATLPTLSSTTAQGREFAASFQLQCEQLVELVLSDS